LRRRYQEYFLFAQVAKARHSVLHRAISATPEKNRDAFVIRFAMAYGARDSSNLKINMEKEL